MGLVALAAGTARAGCPNQCEASVVATRLEPPSRCILLDGRVQDCDCAVLLEVRNECSASIEALDFSFRSCSGPGATQGDCRLVAPGGRASWFSSLSVLGEQESVLQLRSPEGDHSLHVLTKVESFEDGGCAIVAARPVAGLSLCCVPIVGLALRRRRASRTR
jgi:hypothetical protein